MERLSGHSPAWNQSACDVLILMCLTDKSMIRFKIYYAPPMPSHILTTLALTETCVCSGIRVGIRVGITKYRSMFIYSILSHNMKINIFSITLTYLTSYRMNIQVLIYNLLTHVSITSPRCHGPSSTTARFSARVWRWLWSISIDQSRARTCPSYCRPLTIRL